MTTIPMLDELACAQLTIHATYRADAHDIDGFLDLLTDDAVVVRMGETFAGREALLQMLRKRPRDRVTRHLLGFPAVSRVDDRTARSISYYTLFEANAAEAPSPPYPLHDPTGVGEYHDEYRLTEDGWRISARRILPIFRRK